MVVESADAAKHTKSIPRQGDGQNGKAMRREQGHPLPLLVLGWERVNKVKEVAAILKAIHAQEDRHAAWQKQNKLLRT